METTAAPSGIVREAIKQEAAWLKKRLAKLEAWLRDEEADPFAGTIIDPSRIASNGDRKPKPVKPKDDLVPILEKNGQWMAADKLYDALKDCGAFDGKKRPPSAFLSSMTANAKTGTIFLFYEDGKRVNRIVKAHKISDYTVSLGDGIPFAGRKDISG